MSRIAMNIGARIVAGVALLVFGGCSTAPKVDVTAQTKQAVKRIAIVQAPEPQEYMMMPARNPAGAALYMFGAVGGAILGGIHASTQKTATQKFTQAVAPSKPDMQATFANRIAAGLKAKGYDVAVVAAPPRLSERDDFDFSKLPGAYDGYLVANFNGGYAVSGKRAAPRLDVGVSLSDRTGATKYFSERYVYGDVPARGVTVVKAEPRFVFESEEAVLRNSATAAEALRAGAAKIADEVAARF